MSNSTSVAELKKAQDGANGSAKTMVAQLEKLKPQLALALPKHMNADRMARIALTAVRSNSKLMECTPISVCASVVVSATLGLEIGVLGQAFLVPYWNKTKRQFEAQFIPGWQGLVDLVQRSGRGSVHTGVIFSDQRYTFKDGATRDLNIENETQLDDPKDITHFYAVGWVNGVSNPHIELWPAAKVAKHRDRYNRQGDKHYSFENWEMYGRKIPLLQVMKYMPKSIELANALKLEHAAERGNQGIDLNTLKDVATDASWTPTPDDSDVVDAQQSNETPSVKSDPHDDAKPAEKEPQVKPAEEKPAADKAPDTPVAEAKDPPKTADPATAIADRIAGATDVDVVIDAMQECGEIKDEKQRNDLVAAANKKMAEIRTAKKGGKAAAEGAAKEKVGSKKPQWE